jgi:Receptor L domain
MFHSRTKGFQMFKTHTAAFLTTILALAANACSAHDARPALAAIAAVECEGGVVRNAEEAARFEGCSSVVGDLRISGSDLTDVSTFNQVRSVSGKLVVSNNPKLVSLAGLENIAHARSVELRNNPVLAGYFGILPELSKVEVPLVVEANRGLAKREIEAMVGRVEVQAEQVTANVEGARGERLN